ncbi:hypoxia up-regulated 1, partial [Phenoliferia sp. Uapishka_3]
MTMRSGSSWSLFFLIVALATPAWCASLLAIDFGTDGFKAVLVKPSVPFDVLINKDSKRKTPSLVTLRNQDRSFGSEASNLATRFPKDTFAAIKLLLGHPSTDPQSALHQSLFSNTLSTTSRGSPAIASSSGTFAVEEVLAMQLVYAKEMAEEAAGESVRDTVVTVPSWFGQAERQSVLDAVDLAGMRSIGLVNDGTAAAVNYAMTRTFPPAPSYHLLYDFGAASLRATVFSVRSALLPDPSSLAAKPELKNVTSIIIHGVGFDNSIGGYTFDRIVRDHLKVEFEAKTGKALDGDVRAMAKLLKEAARVKQVLSANSESSARIEGLVDDIDLRSVVTREALESRSASLIPKFTGPIFDALSAANLTMVDVESVILVGGSSRVPMVETTIRDYVGGNKIAKNLNADEAAVMGAALYGAGVTRGFRTKDIRVQDVTLYSVEATYEADAKAEDTESRTITTLLFPAFSKLGTTKTLTLHKSEDFTLQFHLRKPKTTSSVQRPEELFETSITGLTKAYANSTTEEIANATVKVTISLSESNLVTVTSAVLVFKHEGSGGLTLNGELSFALSMPPSQHKADGCNSRTTGKLKGFLGKFGAKPAVNDSATSDSQDPVSREGRDAVEESEGENERATRAKLEGPMRQTPQNTTTVLFLSTSYIGSAPMSADEKTEGKKRLREAKAAETRKLAKDEARNVLESYIYRARDLVDQKSFVDCSLEAERDAIRGKTEAADEWLWKEGDGAPTKELRAKKSELECVISL